MTSLRTPWSQTRVRKISFTGSTATGERIIRADGVKRPSSVEFDGTAKAMRETRVR
jgi:acyl-CoA reductase-like NAD-dependent aldehyde dehydrogenase